MKWYTFLLDQNTLSLITVQNILKCKIYFRNLTVHQLWTARWVSGLWTFLVCKKKKVNTFIIGCPWFRNSYFLFCNIQSVDYFKNIFGIYSFIAKAFEEYLHLKLKQLLKIVFFFPSHLKSLLYFLNSIIFLEAESRKSQQWLDVRSI